MKGTISNKNLKDAKENKKDEFYTQLADIEKELKNYTEHFKGKTILCNCDDPRVSNFFHYFAYNFEKLKLKKLITTCYKNQDETLFTQNKSEKAIYLEYYGDKNGNKIPDAEEIGIQHLEKDGDFRSDECIELLKQSDIIVTNPPFSLFREYVAQLIEYNKKFLIIGNLNAITYKDIFKLIKEQQLWLGKSIHSGDREFGVPEDYPLTAAGSRIDNDGKKYIRVKGVRWFSNLDYTERHEELILYKQYNSTNYPKYDNYDAINVDKTKEIPMDYDKAIGVPITFLDKYNPEQFNVIALGIVGSIEFNADKAMEILDKNGEPTGKYTRNAKGTLYRAYNPKTDKIPAFKDLETGNLYSSIYARVIIKRVNSYGNRTK